jgi:hypothetical protein
VPEDPDALVGLWVERRTPFGNVTVLGRLRARLPSEAGHWKWEFTDPVLQMTRWRSEEGKGDTLLKMYRELDRQYRKHILHEKIGSGGPIPGPPRDFDRYREAYTRAVAEMLHRGFPTKSSTVAVWMGEKLNEKIDRQKLDYWIKQGWLPPLPNSR